MNVIQEAHYVYTNESEHADTAPVYAPLACCWILVVNTSRWLLVPGEPRRLRLEAINSTSVLVEWRPPAEAKKRGVIRGYRVVYGPTTNGSSPALEASSTTRTTAAHVLDVADPATWQAAVTGLLASTMYQFQVAAVGRKGVGERSRPRRVVTKGQGPCQLCTIRCYKDPDP